jgi:hypothetical protein
MSSAAVRCSARQPAASLNNRILWLPMVYPTTLSFDLCSPTPQSAATTRGKPLCPLPSAGFKRLPYIDSLILKVQLVSFVQNCTPHRIHNSAQIRPIVPSAPSPQPVGFSARISVQRTALYRRASAFIGGQCSFFHQRIPASATEIYRLPINADQRRFLDPPVAMANPKTLRPEKDGGLRGRRRLGACPTK